jgi:hypothetical protein
MTTESSPKTEIFSMDETSQSNRVLETAWHRYAQLDANATKSKSQYMRLKRTIAYLSVLAVLFAILVDHYSPNVPSWGQLIFRVLLILTPIATSIIAAFTNKFQQGHRYLASRAAAEEILKEIYIYRTVLKNSKSRNKWLSDRLAAIMRKLYRAVGGELILEPYDGDLPPYHDPSRDYSDPGFKDLSGEEYVTYRLEDQLAWHIKKNLELQRDRKRIQWLILVFGGLGSFLAAWGGPLVLWVAFTSAIASVLIGWEELRGLDMKVANYSQVVLELNIIRDHWLMLSEEERTQAEANKIVRQTENLLWNQNTEFINAMRKAFADAKGDEDELIQHALEKAQESTEQIKDKLYAETEELIDEGADASVEKLETAIDDSVESLHQMFADMQAIREEELAKQAASEAEAEAPEAAVVEETFVDEDFSEDFVDEDFEEEVFDDEEDFEDENFVDENFDDDLVDEDFEEEDFVDEDFGEGSEEILGASEEFLDNDGEDEQG